MTLLVFMVKVLNGVQLINKVIHILNHMVLVGINYYMLLVKLRQKKLTLNFIKLL